MRPLIKTNTQLGNIVSYLELELAKIVVANETLCFTTVEDLTVTVVDKHNAKYLKNQSSLVNVNPVSIPRGTRLFIPLADLAFKQRDTDLTIQHALNSNGECLQFIKKSLFDDYEVRYLTFNLIDGSIEIKLNQPKTPKPIKVSDRQMRLNIALKWLESERDKLGFKSITEVFGHYKSLYRWDQIHYWHEWSKIAPNLFPTDKFDRNLFSKQINPYLRTLQE